MYSRYKEYIEKYRDALFRPGRQNFNNFKSCNDTDSLDEVGEAADFEYDLIVIGGGSGGLSASTEAANLGMRVACLDYVKPSPQGTTWNLGGTCVNVGCIPKKLMHQAALLGNYVEDAGKYGWHLDETKTHDWNDMTKSVQEYIGSVTWNCRVSLRSKHVKYINGYGAFVGPHELKSTNKKGVETIMTSRYFLLAMGGRPKYPDIPGIKEYCISSDDLFSLPYAPGRTLLIGASYVSLETAGFLEAFGYDVTVLVRSILLRGFDQEMAEKVGAYMSENGVRFIRKGVPKSVERLEEGQPGKYKVTIEMQDGTEIIEEFNTVMIAVGRDPCTSGIGLDKVGVQLTDTGYVVHSDWERTTCPYIYAIGDVLENKPELTPVAIQAGRLLAKRLFAGSKQTMDYDSVPTAVFTPLEYGCIGLSEEDAIARHGEDDIQVYHSFFQPLEWTVAKRDANTCFVKLVCVISQSERVVGFHLLSPNAGEITQGFTMGLKLAATKTDFDFTVGIHPTCAEVFTGLVVTKRSGQNPTLGGC